MTGGRGWPSFSSAGGPGEDFCCLVHSCKTDSADALVKYFSSRLIDALKNQGGVAAFMTMLKQSSLATWDSIDESTATANTVEAVVGGKPGVLAWSSCQFQGGVIVWAQGLPEPFQRIPETRQKEELQINEQQSKDLEEAAKKAADQTAAAHKAAEEQAAEAEYAATEDNVVAASIRLAGTGTEFDQYANAVKTNGVDLEVNAY